MEQELDNYSCKELAKSVRIDSIAELAFSSSYIVRTNATKLLYVKAVNSGIVPYLCACAMQTTNAENRMKAVSVIQSISLYRDLLPFLIEHGAPRVLCMILRDERCESVLKDAIMALFEIIAEDESVRFELISKHELLGSLSRILIMSKNRDLINWAILHLHNLAVTEKVQLFLISKNCFHLFGFALRVAFGNWTLQKVCFHALVRLLEPLCVIASREHLSQLDEFNIVGLISSSVRQDDAELVYWSLGLLHEFSIRDVFLDKFRKMNSLIVTIVNLLNTNDTPLSKIILRILKFMGLKNPEFQKKIIGIEVVSRVAPFLAASDDDCQYWALTLLHDLVSIPTAHTDLLLAPEFQCFLEIVLSPKNIVPLYVADILNHLCMSNIIYYESFKETQMFSAVMALLNRNDPDLVKTGLTCMFNLLLHHDSFAQEFLELNVVSTLARISTFYMQNRGDTVLGKVCCILASMQPSCTSSLAKSVVLPFLVNSFVNLGHLAIETIALLEEKDNETPFNTERFSEFGIDVSTIITRIKKTARETQQAIETIFPTKSELEDITVKILVKLQSCLTAFQSFLLYTDLIRVLLVENVELGQVLTDSLLEIIFFDDEISLSPRKTDKMADYYIGKLFIDAMNVFGHLLNYDLISEYAQEQHALDAILEWIEKHKGSEEEAVIALFRATRTIPRSKFIETRALFCLWQILCRSIASQASKFAVHGILCYLISRDGHNFVNPAIVNMSRCDHTEMLLLSPNGLEAWNYSISFESVRGTFGVIDCGKYYYEVEIHSDGLIQIGWASQSSNFDSICGRGVGDDDYSYSHDGLRQRLWHGKSPHSNGIEYGKKWKTGDVISCCIDLIEFTIEYYLNGQSLGIAFRNIPENVAFYPAISLAAEQGCSLRFNSMGVNIKYVLDNSYIPLSYAANSCDSPQSDQTITASEDLPLNLDPKIKVKMYLELQVSWRESDTPQIGWIDDLGGILYINPEDGMISWSVEDVEIKAQEPTGSSTISFNFNSKHGVVGLGIALSEDRTEHVFFTWEGKIIAVVEATGWALYKRLPYTRGVYLESANLGQFKFKTNLESCKNIENLKFISFL